MNELVDLGAVHPALSRLERPTSSTTPGLSRCLGARFAVDPLLIRMFFILLTPVGGVGVVVYTWGVLLTPREGRGVAPITRLLPQFRSWAPRTQWLGIGVSSVLAAAAVSWIVPISALPVPLLGLAVVLVKRYRSPVRSSSGTHQVEHGPQLPVVDLYAPEPEIEAPAPRHVPGPVPTSWLGAAAIAILGVLSFVSLQVLSGSRFLGAAGALGTIGAATTGWALLLRSRRLPTVFLLGLLLVAGIFGTLASLRVSVQRPGVVAPGTAELTHTYVADSAVLDLRHLPEDAASEVISIEAVASEVHVLLASAPAGVEISRTLSDVDLVPTGGSASSSPGPQLRITAAVSDVTVEYPG
ncbi:MAG: hypothetical protein Q4D89_01630 [Arachnia propionica]|uniref:PspC domain-containing protein n=1 Tax=Arachnia propionica TaxID=1750 RepID=UPI0026FB9167|nr:hypothetical protein [Arachnia propionica]